MANMLDVRQFETYVSACARNSGVHVTWDAPDSTPRTDGRSMWIPRITSSATEEWLQRIRYYVKHETSHIVHSDFVFLNKKKPTGLLALINNLIEDHRIDYRNDKEYKGDSDISNDYWRLYADDVEKRAKSSDAELSEQQLLTLPLFIWDSESRDWIGSSGMVHAAMHEHATGDCADKLEKLAAYTDDLVEVREYGDAQAVWDLSVRILTEVFDQQEEDHVQDEKGKGEGGEGTADGGSDTGAKGKDGSESGGKDDIIKVDKLMESIGHEHKASRTGISYTGKFDTRGEYIIPRSDEYIICSLKDIPPKVSKYLDPKTDFKRYEVEAFITSNAHSMSSRLRIKLQTRSRDRYEYGKKKGKLHNGSLHKVLSGDDGLSSRVFRQRVVSDTTDTAVVLLVDCSGSMSGRKYAMACAGAGTFAEALKPLNIPFAVYGFTNEIIKDDPVIWHFSDFGQRVSTADLIAGFSVAAGGLWENTDGDAVAYAHYRLTQRKEKRKVLLVLSDGAPHGRVRAGNIAAYTKQAIASAEASGVDVYGIGIMDRSVQQFYKKHVVVSSLGELAPTILNVVDRSI